MKVVSNPIRYAKKAKMMGTHYVLKQYLENKRVGAVSEEWLHTILDDIDATEVFCHVGLSAVNAAFDGHPYEFLRTTLGEHFETVMVPGFTDYFEQSRVFYKQYSKPKHGTFAKLLLEDAEYRTNDAMRSFVVDGPYRFGDCDDWDSYGDNSCFAKLEADNVPILDIGTPWFKSSQIHYIEYQHDVPYIEDVSMDGIAVTESGADPVEISQAFGAPTERLVWNRRKLHRDLEAAGVLDRYDMRGLRVMVTRTQDLRDVIGPKLDRDGYYLLT
ncbi:MAG: AAC(3) family N-acetyltransferase [Halobacteriota archaeon]